MPSFLYSLSIYFAFATTTPLLCAANFVSVPFTSMLRRNPARPLSGLQSSSMRSKSPANFQRHVLCTLRGKCSMHSICTLLISLLRSRPANVRKHSAPLRC
ncbi:hypothetical protein IWX48DRAFT_618118 [Phyllosticta citricarpa]